jgi:hypothetical protein
VNGVFQDGTTLSGTITFSTCAGCSLFPASADLITSSPNANSFQIVSGLITPSGYADPADYPVFGYEFHNGDIYLGLLFLGSPVGYNGGPLCGMSNSSSCLNSTSGLDRWDLVNPYETITLLESGTVAPVPEPASMTFIGGAVSLLFVRKSRK